MKQLRWIVLLTLLSLVLAACPAAVPTAAPAPASGGDSAAAAPTDTPAAEAPAAEASTGELTKIRLQLQWVTQSQFAGYYAALDQGFYKDEGLDVEILEGAVEIVPQQVVAAGDAEFGIAWVPKVLASREQGADLVNIAQIFQRSGTLEISWKDSGITKPEDWKGKKVGTWGFGNEFELYAALRKAGIEPDDASQVTIVQQPFDMQLLLNKEIDAAEAMTYNEYAQVLEAKNPATGELYKPEDLSVINFNDVGTAMLQDHIFTSEKWLAEEGHEDLAVKFLRASFKGWIFCRDNFDQCVDIVLKNGPTLGKGHMAWQLNEINDLIWPSPAGIGVMDENLWKQTVDISTEFKVLTAAPSDGAYRTDLAQKAIDSMTDIDTKGEGFKKQTVEVTPGGE
ncbi:MAG: ABC transporter substrate-binding protein [Caldilineaceae bacterium]